MPRSQGGENRVENGLPLCGPWSKLSPHSNGCHAAKTARRLKISRSWLDADQIEYLAEKKWVAWDDSGMPYGQGWRGFQPAERKVADATRARGPDSPS